MRTKGVVHHTWHEKQVSHLGHPIEAPRAHLDLRTRQALHATAMRRRLLAGEAISGACSAARAAIQSCGKRVDNVGSWGGDGATGYIGERWLEWRVGGPGSRGAGDELAISRTGRDIQMRRNATSHHRVITMGLARPN